jgi:hypothetical protein
MVYTLNLDAKIWLAEFGGRLGVVLEQRDSSYIEGYARLAR